jgi:hypothetical protein
MLSISNPYIYIDVVFHINFLQYYVDHSIKLSGRPWRTSLTLCHNPRSSSWFWSASRCLHPQDPLLFFKESILFPFPGGGLRKGGDPLCHVVLPRWDQSGPWRWGDVKFVFLSCDIAISISSDSAEDFYGNTFCRLLSRRKTLEELSPWEGWQGSPSLAARGTGPCSGLLVLFWWPFSEFSFGVYLRSSPKIKSCPWVFCPLLNI